MNSPKENSNPIPAYLTKGYFTEILEKKGLIEAFNDVHGKTPIGVPAFEVGESIGYAIRNGLFPKRKILFTDRTGLTVNDHIGTISEFDDKGYRIEVILTGKTNLEVEGAIEFILRLNELGLEYSPNVPLMSALEKMRMEARDRDELARIFEKKLLHSQSD